jgi:hypothetical protein
MYAHPPKAAGGLRFFIGLHFVERINLIKSRCDIPLIFGGALEPDLRF